MYIDLQRFIKSLCLKKYFLKNPNEKIPEIELFKHTNLREKSIFFPKSMLSNEINTFENMVKIEISKLQSKMRKDNLTKGERKALRDLSNEENVIIKPADKGGGIVLLTKEYYEQEANKILGNSSTYRMLYNPI